MMLEQIASAAAETGVAPGDLVKWCRGEPLTIGKYLLQLQPLDFVAR